jgi:hypothetical protein
MSKEDSVDNLYAAVPLPNYLGYRQYKVIGASGIPTGGRGLGLDLSVLPFTVEELISQGATHLAISGESAYCDALDLLANPT